MHGDKKCREGMEDTTNRRHRTPDPTSTRFRLGVGLLVGLLLAPIAAATASPRAASAASTTATIFARGAAAFATFPSNSTTSLNVTLPSAQPGDLLIASIGIGRVGATSQPTVTPPPGWSLVGKTNRGSTGTLAVFRHLVASGDPPVSWTTNIAVGGVLTIVAFTGVDAGNPIDISAGQAFSKGAKVSAPSLTTTSTNEMLVSSFAGFRNDAKTATWTAPAGMVELADAANGSWSGSADDAIKASAGSTGSKTATASQTLDFSIGALTALRPATLVDVGGGTATPLIIDSDLFTSVDDVGALATAFGLQLRGEATVIAVTLNTRTSRPVVQSNSWKCAAAINQFYGSSAIPIGSDMPDDGTETNATDFVGRCGRLAAASTPAPGAAVDVLRRSLTAQADGTVVVGEVGYLENLARLLDSPPDSISPLSGAQLVARKVKTLVIMGGGFPATGGENNLVGNPAAAQEVSNSWPSKIVWSGYEVGDAVHNGASISSVHPASSPVRASYEAFVGAGNWYYSYDLTALYHAVRPSDPLLTEVGPGTNVISDSGANTFLMGAGNQFYLALGDASALGARLETLIDALPPSSGDSVPPVITGVAASASAPTSFDVSWSTDEPADSQVDYGTSVAYGSLSPLDSQMSTTHSQRISGILADTTYHYRVRSRDAAGNLALSPDASIIVRPQPGAAPADDFNSGSLDTSRWVASSAGSTIGVINQELEISHPGGGWTSGSVQSAAPYDQTGRSVQVQIVRPANGGAGGSQYGESSIFLWLDATHYVYFFAAGSSLTAWVRNGTSEVNVTPSWPRYDPAAMQWIRFRESAGVLYWEYAAGATGPGPWSVLASTAVPFSMTAVTFKISAGSNVSAADVARFDNVSTA